MFDILLIKNAAGELRRNATAVAHLRHITDWRVYNFLGCMHQNQCSSLFHNERTCLNLSQWYTRSEAQVLSGMCQFSHDQSAVTSTHSKHLCDRK